MNAMSALDSFTARTLTLALALTLGSGALDVLLGIAASLYAQACARRETRVISAIADSAFLMEQP